jgi:hypothetical protein
MTPSRAQAMAPRTTPKRTAPTIPRPLLAHVTEALDLGAAELALAEDVALAGVSGVKQE